MTWKLDGAIKEVTLALTTLQADAAEGAREDLLQDSTAIAKYLFKDADFGWSLELGGIDWRVVEGDNPLTVYVHDHEGDGLLHSFDPIGWLIEGQSRDAAWVAKNGEPPLEDSERASIHRAIDALQSGIDRLKAYEARRDQAQS